MQKKFGKVFVKCLSEKKQFVTVPYNPSNDYYIFIKNNCDNNLSQFILTSEIMAKLLNHYFLDRNFNITNIDFINEDSTLKEDIESMIGMISEDRKYFNLLLNNIKFLSTQSSIDITRIEFKSKNTETNTTIRLMLQVNGIFEVDVSNYEYESNHLREFLESLYND